MSRRSVPAPFLTKTYQLVDDPNTDDVISWNEAGTTFVVWRSADFSKDLLPNYFKHSNFSSFVRQLNTYGFRKNVPDKWEFANANFKRGHQELLPKIRRRKTSRAHSAVVGELATVGQTSPSNSGDDMGSTSTSFKNTGPVEVITPAVFSDLSDENEKLRKDNEALSTELTETKTKCDELVAFLTQFVRVDPDQISRIMEQRTSGLGSDGSDTGDDGDDENETEDCLKLFGVYLKGRNKKRGRDEGRDCLALTI